MPKKAKRRADRPKKRKFHGNRYTKKRRLEINEPSFNRPTDDDENTDSTFSSYNNLNRHYSINDEVGIVLHSDAQNFQEEKKVLPVTNMTTNQSLPFLYAVGSYYEVGYSIGSTFAERIKRHGMLFTVNGLYPDFIVETAPPRQFLNRSIIKARNFDEAIELIKNPGYGVAYGFAVNIVDINNPADMWSVEVGPQAKVSLFHVQTVSEEKDSTKPCHYYHINNYKHLNVQEIPNLKSSLARTKRAEELPPPENLQDVLNILGDQENMEYPLYRTKRSTDKAVTVITAVADIMKNRIYFYTENPSKEKIVPLFHLNILDID